MLLWTDAIALSGRFVGYGDGGERRLSRIGPGDVDMVEGSGSEMFRAPPGATGDKPIRCASGDLWKRGEAVVAWLERGEGTFPRHLEGPSSAAGSIAFLRVDGSARPGTSATRSATWSRCSVNTGGTRLGVGTEMIAHCRDA